MAVLRSGRLETPRRVQGRATGARTRVATDGGRLVRGGSAALGCASQGAYFETSCVMRNSERNSTLRRLLSHVRYEVLPTPSAENAVREHLAPGFTVTITASPAKGL